MGDMAWTDNISPDTWMLQMEQINFNGRNLCEDCTVGVDLLTPFIQGPKQAIVDFHNEIGAVEFISGTWAVFCEKVKDLPNVTFIINGKMFVLEPEDYIRRFEKKGRDHCMSAFRHFHRNPRDNRNLNGSQLTHWGLGAWSVHEDLKQAPH